MAQRATSLCPKPSFSYFVLFVFVIFFCFVFVFFSLFVLVFFVFLLFFFDLNKITKTMGASEQAEKNKWMLGSRHLKWTRGFTRFASNITIASALSNRFPCFRVLFCTNRFYSLILYNTQFFVISPHGATFRKINT